MQRLGNLRDQANPVPESFACSREPMACLLLAAPRSNAPPHEIQRTYEGGARFGEEHLWRDDDDGAFWLLLNGWQQMSQERVGVGIYLVEGDQEGPRASHCQRGCKMATDLDVDRDIFNGRIAIAFMVSQGGFRPRCQCPPCVQPRGHSPHLLIPPDPNRPSRSTRCCTTPRPVYARARTYRVTPTEDGREGARHS